ncbi:MAG: glycosyltransferase [Candidatus Limnocylindrales bacterium]
MSLRAVMVPAQSNPYGELLAQAVRAQGIEVVAGEGPRRFPVLPLVFAWLRARRPGVLHLHWPHRYLRPRYRSASLARWGTTFELRLLRRLGVRIVWTIHNVGAHDGGLSDDELRGQVAIASTCHAIICHCEAARALAADAWSLDAPTRSRMHVIPHGNYAGVYPDTYDRTAAREELGLAPDETVLLFLGQIRPYKGVLELIEVFRIVEGERARLLVAGQVERRALTEALREAAEGDTRITLRPGRVKDKRMQLFLRAADVMVLPYRDVLTSGSAVLGMTFGLPIVAPRIGCLPETLEGCSILYDPDQPGGLRAALEAAMGADLAALGERAAEAAASLEWGPIGARTAALYRGDATT